MRISDWSSDVCSSDLLRFYAFPDDEHPTLVVGDGKDITWAVLAEAAPALSTLLDGRMRSFETFMLRIAARRPTDNPREKPSDEELEIGRASCRERVFQYG